MAPRHEYDLRVSAITHSYDVAENIKSFRAKLESDELIVPHENGAVTLDKLNEFVFVDEGDDEDPEYVENSDESEDSLEYLSEYETPCRDYDLRAPMNTTSCGVDDLKPVTVRLEWEQLIVPHEEGDVTLDKLKEFVFEEEDVEEDPEYEESIVDSDDPLEYESDESEVDSESDEVEEDPCQYVLASVISKSCLLNMVENEDVSWGVSNKTEEYIASFRISQFGIRVADSGLSIVETPLSYFSTWLYDGLRHTRRHLRAVRRAGEKQNSNSCKSRSLLVQLGNLFPLSAILGLRVVESTSYKCGDYVTEEDLDDPEYLLSCEESDDSLEFRSEIDSEEDLDSDVGSASIESSDMEEKTDSFESSDVSEYMD